VDTAFSPRGVLPAPYFAAAPTFPRSFIVTCFDIAPSCGSLLPTYVDQSTSLLHHSPSRSTNDAAADVVTRYVLRSTGLPWVCCAAAAAAARFSLVAAVPMICHGRALLDRSAATFLCYWIRSRPYLLAVLGHGRMPLCARPWRAAASVCQAVAPCGRRGWPLAACWRCAMPLCACCCALLLRGHGRLLHISLQGWPCRCAMLLHMYKL